jgi:hypothetical protein
MHKSNFDSSSTGLDITLSACYDTDLSYMYFEECFTRLGDQLVYGEGNLSDFEKDYTFTVNELKGAVIDEFCGKYCTLDELKADTKEFTGSSWSKVKKEELIDYVKNSRNWIEFCEKYRFKPNFDIVVSRGYCQGDYKEVIVPHAFWEAIDVPKPECVQSNLGSTISNLLWYCPVYCRFTVNGEEFYIDQELKDSYNWDKSEALEIASKLIEEDYTEEQKDIIMQFLASALPNQLDYQ